MRVFIAVDLPGEVREQLGQIQRELEPLSGKARWVAPASIHITLKFLGEIPDKQIEAIDTALTGLTWKAFTVTVSGVGFFPGNRSPECSGRELKPQRCRGWPNNSTAAWNLWVSRKRTASSGRTSRLRGRATQRSILCL